MAIPKGLIEPGEDGEAAARREVGEELGVMISGPLVPLGEIRQSGGKIVIAFTAEHDLDPAMIVSNTIEIEWPRGSGQMLTIPKVDEARWFALEEARRSMLASQVPLIERLVSSLQD